MIKHLCSYCGGRDIESHETAAIGFVVNGSPNIAYQNDLARVICDQCQVKIYDAVLGLPRFRFRYEGTWIREPWLREVE